MNVPKNLNVPLALVCLLFAAGCTHIIRPPAEPYSFVASQQKMNLAIGLRITAELRQAQWEKHGGGDTWLMPVGEWLASNSLGFASHLFAEVTDVSGDSQNANRGLDAILTPRVVFVNRTNGATSFGESITAVKVEWDLRTPEGNPIWIQTVSGEARGSTGWSNPEEILAKALDDLMTNSKQAFNSSQSIARFQSSLPSRRSSAAPATR